MKVKFLYKWLILTVAPVLISSNGYSQSSIESLKEEIRTTNNDSILALKLNDLSYAMRNINGDSALKYNQQAIRLALNKNLQSSSRNYIQTRGQIFDFLGQTDSAIHIYTKLLQKDTVLFPASAAWIYDRLGILDAEMGYFNRSLDYLLKALALYKKHQPEDEIIPLTHLAQLFYYNHDYNRAKSYAQQAQLLAESSTAEQRFAACTIFGTLYLWKGNYDSTLYFYNKVYDSSVFPVDSYVHGDYYHIIGRLTETKGDKRSGVKYLKKALELKEKNNSYYSRIITHYALAEAYFEIAWYEELDNYLDTALFHIHKVIKDAEYRKDIRLQKTSNGLASDIFAAKANLHEYYRHKNRFMNLTDSLFNIRRDAEMLELESKYLIKEKEVENLNLVNENLSKESMIKIQRYLFIGAALLLLIAGGILYLIYRNNLKVKALNRQITKSNKTKDRLFSIISHDLRGPIASFETTPKILKNYLDRNQPEKLREMVDHIDKSAKNIHQLLDNLLSWSLTQKGELILTIEKLAIKPIIDETIAIFKETAAFKGITIQSNIKDQHIMADRNTFATVVRNLISNAIKFSHSGSMITINHRIQDNWLEFSFSDTGVGMTEEQLQKLFDIDKSKVRTGTTHEKGTGLGMVLVKEFIDMNQGKITVHSKPEKGTTFFVYMPLAS